MDDPSLFFLPSSPFAIKDLMLGEFLSQGGILTDAQVLRATTVAKTLRKTLGSAFCQLGWLTPRELFQARRILNRYLADPENMAQAFEDLKLALGCQTRCEETIHSLYARQASMRAS